MCHSRYQENMRLEDVYTDGSNDDDDDDDCDDDDDDCDDDDDDVDDDNDDFPSDTYKLSFRLPLHQLPPQEALNYDDPFLPQPPALFTSAASVPKKHSQPASRQTSLTLIDDRILTSCSTTSLSAFSSSVDI